MWTDLSDTCISSSWNEVICNLNICKSNFYEHEMKATVICKHERNANNEGHFHFKCIFVWHIWPQYLCLKLIIADKIWCRCIFLYPISTYKISLQLAGSTPWMFFVSKYTSVMFMIIFLHTWQPHVKLLSLTKIK